MAGSHYYHEIYCFQDEFAFPVEQVRAALHAGSGRVAAAALAFATGAPASDYTPDGSKQNPIGNAETEERECACAVCVCLY